MGFSRGGLKRTVDGACFPDRPYFPLLLANGQDALLINPIGSTDSVTRGNYSGTLNEKLSLGWHKTDRKDFRAFETRNADSLCLAELHTFHFIGTEAIVPDRVEQFFDPRAATLTTQFRQHSHRDPGQVRFKAQTFLTDDHLLVEHYEILETPQTAYHQEYRIRPAIDARGSLLGDSIRAEDVVFARLEDAVGLCFTYRLAGLRGVGALWVVVEGADPSCIIGEASPEWVVSSALSAGCRVTRYATVIDDKDAPDPSAVVAGLVQRTLHEGYDAIYSAHRQAWGAYFGKAVVRLPEDDLQHLYDTSLYVLRAAQDPNTGFLPMGILPYQWQNCMFWDSWFASMAWLGCHRAEYAQRIADFWTGKREEGRQVAAAMGYEGARFDWNTHRDRFSRTVRQVIQFHNNGLVAIQAAQVADASGNKASRARSFPVMEDALRFLLNRLLVIEDGKARLAACAGPDESTLDRKSTDTWTCAVMVKGLDDYLHACRSLERKPFREDLPTIRALLWEALERNIDSQGVLQPFEGGFQPHWGCLVFSLFPDHPAWRQTLAALCRYDEELDGYNSFNLVRYSARIFLWAEYWAIRILGEHGEPSGWERLRKNAKFTDRFGGMPERVTYMSEIYRHWFMTAHASYLWAVHGLLLRRHGDQLCVLCNLPSEWANLSFDNLTTHDGLRVSAALQDGSVQSIQVVNDHVDPRCVELVAPGLTHSGKVVLAPGESRRYPDGGDAVRGSLFLG